MAKRGPKPKPAALKLLAGNPGKRPVDGRTPPRKLAAVAPDKPADLSPEAAAEWDRVVPELAAIGTLAAIDRAALVIYVTAWSDLAAATKLLEAEGDILREPIQSSRGEVVGERRKLHPAVRLKREAFDRVRSMLAAFGLTPAARGVQAADGGTGPAANRVLSIADRVAAARLNGGS